MLLSQHNHAIQALAPDRAHQPLRQRILPRALRCGQDFDDAYVVEAIPETFAAGLVPISDQVSWRRVLGERFQDLLSRPSRCRMLGHVEMKHPAPTMAQHHQNKQNPKSGGGHGKEIDGDQLVYVIVDERLPGLRRGFAASGQKSRHSSFGDEDTQLQQLSVDAGCTPKRVGDGHLQDQSSNRGADFWTSALPPGNPGPEQAKALAMPSHDRLPKEAIPPSQPRPGALSLEHGELLTKGQVLQGDISALAGETRRRSSEPSSGNMASSA
jgi:hypothetical protein